MIVDAIRDRNVLQFQIDYRGKYTAKGMATNDSYEEDVEGIDTKELYDNPQRLEMIARYIVNIHDTKTRNREFAEPVLSWRERRILLHHHLARHLAP